MNLNPQACVILAAVLILIVALEHYNHLLRIKTQNIKAINLYLNQQFIRKLLHYISENNSSDKLNKVSDEVMLYFCLDIMLLKKDGENNCFLYKNKGTLYLTNQDIDDYFKLATPSEERSLDDTMNYHGRSINLFRNLGLCMITLPERGYSLTRQEKVTLKNEVIMILNIAYNFQHAFNSS